MHLSFWEEVGGSVGLREGPRISSFYLMLQTFIALIFFKSFILTIYTCICFCVPTYLKSDSLPSQSLHLGFDV